MQKITKHKVEVSGSPVKVTRTSDLVYGQFAVILEGSGEGEVVFRPHPTVEDAVKSASMYGSKGGFVFRVSDGIRIGFGYDSPKVRVLEPGETFTVTISPLGEEG